MIHGVSSFSPAGTNSIGFGAAISSRPTNASTTHSNSTPHNGLASADSGAAPSSAEKRSVEAASVGVTDVSSIKKAEAAKAAEAAKTSEVERQQLEEIRNLAARDREVRTHEKAHAAIGGAYAGAPVYTYERGPDGVSYAVGGEVSISTSKEATPEATLRKAQIVRRAALAPAEPSPQDRKVAALASQMAAEAMMEIQQMDTGPTDPSRNVDGEDTVEQAPNLAEDSPDTSTASSSRPDATLQSPSIQSRLSLYNDINQLARTDDGAAQRLYAVG